MIQSSTIVLLLALSVAESAKILVIFHAPAPSHNILGSALAKGLAEAGHDVTYVNPFPEKNPPKNGTYRLVELKGIQEKLAERRSKMGSSNMFDMSEMNPFVVTLFMLPMMSQMCEVALEHEDFQKLIKSKESFDVIVMEQFVNECFKPLVTTFNAKSLILFSTVGANSWINPLVANPSPLSYIPEIFLSYSSNMTFWERTVNTVFNAFSQTIYKLIVFPEQNKLAQKYISPEANIYDHMYNASFVLLNSHPSMNQAVPKVPAMVDVGGFHVQPPKKLPADLQKFLDEAKDGVVYFSMGSNLKSKDLPPEKREAFLKVFSQLKEKVLWKWEEETMPGQPPNVKFGKWLPQQDILAHPNVKVFITHGGLLSTTETTYHGVPVLAIPIFGDQKINAKTAVNNGIGLSLDYKQITEEALSEKLNGLLKNPKYKTNAKTRAAIFHDRLVKPMDSIVYWVEYIIRHNGAPHLRVTGVDLPWYKYHLIDVLAFLAVIGLVVLYVQIWIAKRILRRFCTKCQTKNKTVKQKQN